VRIVLIAVNQVSRYYAAAAGSLTAPVA